MALRKLSEIKGEEALDTLADLLDPVSDVFSDEKFAEYIRKGKKLQAIETALRYHKRSVLSILAILEGEDVKDYKPSLAKIPIMCLKLLNDPDLIAVFQSADPKNSSGSATGNIQAIEKE